MLKYKSTASLYADDKGPYLLHHLSYQGCKTNLKTFLVDYKGCVDVREPHGRTPLMYAVLADNRECIVILLRAKADINAKDSIGRTALHYAADYGFHRSVKLLVTGGANWKLCDKEGVTALHLSSIHSSPRCLKQIIQFYNLEDYSIDVQDNDKRTALHWSACCGNVANVKILLKNNCNAGIPDIKGLTPLHWAVISQTLDAAECIKYLLRSGPNLINWCDNDGQTALHFAVAENALYAIEELISCEYGNVDVPDNQFRTPLHLACLLGLTNVVSLLLKHNARMNTCDMNEATPLHYAAASNSDTLKALLSQHVDDVNHKDKNGRDAVAWAVIKGEAELVAILISHGANLRDVDGRGATAAAYGHINIMEFFLESSLSVNEVDTAGRSPLFDACCNNQLSMVKYLLKYGAKRDLLDKEEKTPLHWAAANGHTDICRLLFSHGYQVDAVDIWGRTSLFYAVFGNYLECSSFLIEIGANPHHWDYEGLNSLHWASRKGHLDMAKLLMCRNVNPNTLHSKNRLTALDFACLGEHHTVTHYLLEHAAVSMVYIENMAATKIQKAYRKYKARIRDRCGIVPESRDANSLLKNRFKIYEKRAKKSYRRSKSECGQTFSYNSPPRRLKTESCHQSEVYKTPMEINLSEDSFKFLQENSVKAMHMNRKTELGGCGRDRLGSFYKKFEIKSSSMIELQQNEAKRPDKKSLWKSTARTLTQVDGAQQNVVQGNFNSFSFFDSFVRNSFNITGEKMINYNNFQQIFSVPILAPNLDDSNNWYLKRALRKAASKEWLTIIGRTAVDECPLHYNKFQKRYD